MKTALITTTINVPKVLALYRKYGPDVAFFVAGDLKTPPEADTYCTELPNTVYMSPEFQRLAKYESSEHIGWSTDSRRNFALLEALRWGADVIVSIDDDMIPLSPDFFRTIGAVFAAPWSGLQIGAPREWLDAGRFTVPSARQRGLPPFYNTAPRPFSAVHDVTVGAMQGIILGVPDTDAGTTVAQDPFVLGASDVLRHGFVVEPGTWSVFDSQITAFRRELAPCFAQFYRWQERNTDLFASLLMRRIMRDRQMYTYFGPPFGFHARQWRDPIKDMQAEAWGLRHIRAFAVYLDETDAVEAGRPALEQVASVYADLQHSEWFPQGAADAAIAWCNDCEAVL